MLRRESQPPRRESVGRVNRRTVSVSDPPAMQMVTVAVLPPRLPSIMAPPTGVGMADAFNWDEMLNWTTTPPPPTTSTSTSTTTASSTLQRIQSTPSTPTAAAAQQLPERQRKPSFLRQTFSPTRRRAHPDSDRPPFVMRQVPYETWRRHYAKDAEGNYRGTHAPAEDCLLKPHDVQRWRLEEATMWVDKFTRGKEVLPVYDEVRSEGAVPDYEDCTAGRDVLSAGEEYDRPPRGEPSVEEMEDLQSQRMRIEQQGETGVESGAVEGAERQRLTSLESVSEAAAESPLDSLSIPRTQSQPAMQPVVLPQSSTLVQQDSQQQQQQSPPKLYRDENSGLAYDTQKEREQLLARNNRKLSGGGWKGKLQRGLHAGAKGLAGGGTG